MIDRDRDEDLDLDIEDLDTMEDARLERLAREWEEAEEEDWEEFRDDDDAGVFRGIGWGTDEDYGHFGSDDY